MERIETSFSTPLPAEQVYEALHAVENIPLFAPGIAEARPLDEPFDAGLGAATNLVDLMTRRGRHLDAQVMDLEPGHLWEIEDENGTIARWELQERGGETQAIYTLEGAFHPEDLPALEAEVQAKLARLLTDLEASG